MIRGLPTIELIGSPLRNLVAIISFVLAVVALGVVGYLIAGWSFGDALYMVVLTVYTVGYGEVRPIDTPYLHAVTVGVMVMGCTGMIILTGVLVQVFTVVQLEKLFGRGRVQSEIDKLSDHVIICGFGRIGRQLAKELSAGGIKVLILDRGEARVAEAQALGYLAMSGDATDEAALEIAGIGRARCLATVLPDDAANVFITLSARKMNARVQIIARGEAPSTEGKLVHAGANKVVLPTHIGAERIAELILFPETARYLHGSEAMREFEKSLRGLGLEVEVVVAAEKSSVVGQTVADLERRSGGRLFVVQINGHDGKVTTRPPPDVRIRAGDGVVVVGREGRGELSAVFEAPRSPIHAGRTIVG